MFGCGGGGKAKIWHYSYLQTNKKHCEARIICKRKSAGQGMLEDIWNAWNISPMLSQGIIVEILLRGFISLEGKDLWREMQLSEPAMVLCPQDQGIVLYENKK